MVKKLQKKVIACLSRCLRLIPFWGWRFIYYCTFFIFTRYQSPDKAISIKTFVGTCMSCFKVAAFYALLEKKNSARWRKEICSKLAIQNKYMCYGVSQQTFDPYCFVSNKKVVGNFRKNVTTLRLTGLALLLSWPYNLCILSNFLGHKNIHECP